MDKKQSLNKELLKSMQDLKDYMNVPVSYLTMGQFNRILRDYETYERKVSEIATRSGLEAGVVAKEAREIYNSSGYSMVSILDHMIFLTQHGKKMPWEEDS